LAGPEFILAKLAKRQDCDRCGNGNAETLRHDRRVTFLCGEHTANILPPENLTIELSKIGDGIPSENILLSTDSVLVYRHREFTVSLFRNGRLLIGGVEDEIKPLSWLERSRNSSDLKTDPTEKIENSLSI